MVTLAPLTLALMTQAVAPLQVRLELDGPRPSLVGPIWLTARITNQGPGPIDLDDPRSSGDAVFAFVHQETREAFAFSTSPPLEVTQLGGDRQALVVPTRTVVTLKAGESIDLRVDAAERLFLVPGRYVVSFAVGVERSNEVRVETPLRLQELRRLLALAGDSRASFARRTWAVEVLRRVHPLEAAPPAPEVQGDERSTAERATHEGLDVFRKWLDEQPPRRLRALLAGVTR